MGIEPNAPKNSEMSKAIGCPVFFRTLVNLQMIRIKKSQ